MRIHRLADNLSMIDAEPPIRGFDEFIGVYVLHGRSVALVDAGPRSSAENLINGLRELNIDPNAVSHILLTHIHLDHAGAVGALAEFLPNATVVVHPQGADHVANPDKLWKGSLNMLGHIAEEYGKPQGVSSDRIVAAKEGMRIGLGDGLELETIYTPGHAAHHMSFIELGSNMLFAGEVAGVYIGTLDISRPATPPPLRLEQELASISKLLDWRLTTIYYSHFGFGGDARNQLLRQREQLKLWQELIGEAMGRGADSEMIFAELLAKDANLGGLRDLPQEQYQRESYFINNSIKGFIDHLSKQNV